MDFIIAIIIIGFVINSIKKAKQQNTSNRNTHSDPYQPNRASQGPVYHNPYEMGGSSGSIGGFESTEGECVHEGTHTAVMSGEGEGYSGEGYAQGTDQSDHRHSNPASTQTILQSTIASSMGDNMAHRLNIRQPADTLGRESLISNAGAYIEKTAISNKINQAVVYNTKTVGQIAAANVAQELRTAGLKKAIVYSELLKRPKLGVAPRYR